MGSVTISPEGLSDTAKQYLAKVGNGVHFGLEFDAKTMQRPAIAELLDKSGAPLADVPPTVRSELRSAALANGWVGDLFSVEHRQQSTQASPGNREIKRADFDVMPPADQRKAMRAGAKLVD